MQRIKPAWVMSIRREAAALQADEDHVHNNLMQEMILKTWERTSPVMWGRLSEINLQAPLAMVLQARMWKRKAELMRAGMPVTDAREVAERETLMLEPEAEQENDRLANLESLMTFSLDQA